MKTLVEFIKATLAGGFFVLLPVSLLCLLLAEMFELAVAVATPITLIFPEGAFDEAKFPVVLAVGLILVTSLILGVLMRSSWGKGLGSWVERRMLSPIPGYEFLKSLTSSLGGAAEVNRFRAALRQLPDGSQQAVYIVEESKGGMCTVLIPHAPAAMSGPVELVSREQLTMLNIDFGSYMQTLNHWGTGLGRLPETDGVDSTSSPKET